MKFKGIQSAVSYDMLRSLLCGSSDEQYNKADAVTKVRQILDEEPQREKETFVTDNKIVRCINKHVDGGFLKSREGFKKIRLNFTNRRLVNPKYLDLPEPIKISSVPWGYSK